MSELTFTCQHDHCGKTGTDPTEFKKAEVKLAQIHEWVSNAPGVSKPSEQPLSILVRGLDPNLLLGHLAASISGGPITVGQWNNAVKAATK